MKARLVFFYGSSRNSTGFPVPFKEYFIVTPGSDNQCCKVQAIPRTEDAESDPYGSKVVELSSEDEAIRAFIDDMKQKETNMGLTFAEMKL
jgi:hypothetical protein